MKQLVIIAAALVLATGLAHAQDKKAAPTTTEKVKEAMKPGSTTDMDKDKAAKAAGAASDAERKAARDAKSAERKAARAKKSADKKAKKEAAKKAKAEKAAAAKEMKK